MAEDPQQEQTRKYGQVVARAWQDAAFRARLLADPGGVLREQGIEVPAGTQVRVVENTDEVFHLVLPRRPRDLADDQLDQAAGGYDGGGYGGYVG
jgi:hypothetical protein